MMTMRLHHYLNTAENGQQLALVVLDAVRAGETVQLDFEDVEVLTPSYANALVMTLLASVSLDALRDHCHMVNRSDNVTYTLNNSAIRFQNGIRLSSQRPAIA